MHDMIQYNDSDGLYGGLVGSGRVEGSGLRGGLLATLSLLR